MVLADSHSGEWVRLLAPHTQSHLFRLESLVSEGRTVRLVVVPEVVDAKLSGGVERGATEDLGVGRKEMGMRANCSTVMAAAIATAAT